MRLARRSRLRHFRANACAGPMILTCLQCQTRYRTDAAQFPSAGRKVRCAKCGHIWHQSPPEAEAESFGVPATAAPVGASAGAATVAAETYSSTVISTPASLARTPASSWAERLGLVAGWAGLAGMVVLIGWTGLRFRQEIATLWPQSSSVYARLGMQVNTHGVEIIGSSYHRDIEDGEAVLAVTGKLVNISAREVMVPPIRVTLTDNDQRELYHWTFTPPQSTLQPGQAENFLTRISSPPPGARHLQLRFASQD